jgi:hypothetical protein
MSVTVLSQNAFAPPADPMNRYYIELWGTVKVGASIVTWHPVWKSSLLMDGTMLSGTPSLNGGPDFDRTLHKSELLQGYLDGTTGELFTRYVRYKDRKTFLSGSLPICLYRVDAIGRVVEIDDFRSISQFPGAFSEKEFRTI